MESPTVWTKGSLPCGNFLSVEGFFSTLYCSVAVLLAYNSTMESADGPVIRMRRETSFS